MKKEETILKYIRKASNPIEAIAGLIAATNTENELLKDESFRKYTEPIKKDIKK